MRYELNLESQIIQYDGSVQLIADKKAVLTELFSQGVYECTSINNNGCEWIVEYRNTVNDIRKSIVVYYGNIRNEERSDREKKIQLNGKDPRANNSSSIILGAYCYQSDDRLEDLVFAGWNIDPDINYPSNPSLRGLNIDILQKARFDGFYKHSFRNNYVCTFRPEFIFYYIENIQLIHKLNEEVDVSVSEINPEDVNNVIYYGSPGTGKSYKADEITKGKEVQKVTFHPDYDYHSFVGGYKPTMIENKIAYKFVPQVFTKIYIDAWKSLVLGETKPFYLQIEEINRGNCAEIFGDLFQLLDRKADGSSKYEVTAEEELKKYLESEDGFGTAEHEGIKEGKLRLPSNLKIIATMNTSDQSLFPMDSAFKRRWDWIYVPIDYDCLSSDFTIQLDNGKAFKWLEFLRSVNKEIYEITKTQDKQLGNWFINAQNTGKIISESTFINKVFFYLWNDVFKDEENTIFKSADGENLTYTSFFEKTANNHLVSYILEERLKLTDISKVKEITAEEE